MSAVRYHSTIDARRRELEAIRDRRMAMERTDRAVCWLVAIAMFSTIGVFVWVLG